MAVFVLVTVLCATAPPWAHAGSSPDMFDINDAELPTESKAPAVYNMAFPKEYACAGVANGDPQGFRMKCRSNPPREMRCLCFEQGILGVQLSCSCEMPRNASGAQVPLVAPLGQIHAEGLVEPPLL
jgi:hypothetical protein